MPGFYIGKKTLIRKKRALTKLQQVMGHISLQVSLTYLRGLEVKQLDAEDMPTLGRWDLIHRWFYLSLFLLAPCEGEFVLFCSFHLNFLTTANVVVLLVLIFFFMKSRSWIIWHDVFLESYFCKIQGEQGTIVPKANCNRYFMIFRNTKYTETLNKTIFNTSV